MQHKLAGSIKSISGLWNELVGLVTLSGGTKCHQNWHTYTRLSLFWQWAAPAFSYFSSRPGAMHFSRGVGHAAQLLPKLHLFDLFLGCKICQHKVLPDKRAAWLNSQPAGTQPKFGTTVTWDITFFLKKQTIPSVLSCTSGKSQWRNFFWDFLPYDFEWPVLACPGATRSAQAWWHKTKSHRGNATTSQQ